MANGGFYRRRNIQSEGWGGAWPLSVVGGACLTDISPPHWLPTFLGQREPEVAFQCDDW